MSAADPAEVQRILRLPTPERTATVERLYAMAVDTSLSFQERERAWDLAAAIQSVKGWTLPTFANVEAGPATQAEAGDKYRRAARFAK